MIERESHEYLSGERVEDILQEWVDHAFTMVKTGGSSTDYERGMIAGANHMRGLYLAEPWLIVDKIFKTLKLSGWTPPEGEVLVDYRAGDEP